MRRQLCASLLASLILALPSAYARDVPQRMARVFQLKSASSSALPARERETIHCSASLFKIEGTCRITTNAHCVRAKDGASLPEITLTAPPLAPRAPGDFREREVGSRDFGSDDPRRMFERSAEGQTSEWSVRVLKRDDAFDLAELSLPADVEQTICPLLTETEILPTAEFVTTARVQAVAAIGYVMGREATHVSNDLAWNRGYGASTVTLVPTGVDADSVLLGVNHVRILPGMSGGTSINNWGHVLGITTRFVPMQYQTFIIPLATVARFLRAPAPAMLAGTAPEFSQAIVASHQLKGGATLAGGNSHADGGGNSHGDGGGNSHGDGGASARDERFAKADPLDILAEPDEGFPIARDAGENAGKLLLGVGDRQIDGYDDYARFYTGAGAPHLGLVMRERGKYPERDVRRGLLSRLDGFYQWQGQMQDNRHLVYQEHAESPEGWGLALVGGDLVYIDINSKKSEIILHLFSHSLSPPGEMGKLMQMGEAHITFKVSTSSDDRRISLQSTVSTVGNLECDNRNFLKLNCAGKDLRLSFSYEGKSTKRLHYRFSRVVQVSGKPVISYQFGSLAWSPYADSWRRAQ